MKTDDDFEAFVMSIEPRLRRAFIGAVGTDGVEDAVAEALGFAYEHWSDVASMANPGGYLFRVGQSKSRRRLHPRLLRRDHAVIPEVEPALVESLAALPTNQRTAVWLAHGCGWSHAEIGEVLDVSASTVATHVSRGLKRLRSEMGVESNVES